MREKAKTVQQMLHEVEEKKVCITVLTTNTSTFLIQQGPTCTVTMISVPPRASACQRSPCCGSKADIWSNPDPRAACLLRFQG